MCCPVTAWRSQKWRSAVSNPRRQLWLEVLFVLIVTALALGVRTYRLDEFPPGLFEDEAAYGLDALDVMQGHFPVFFERNNGREPLYIYLEALVMGWLGATPYALRFTAALVGTLTIPVFYWLVRTLFGGTTLSARWMASWATLFLAFSYWHLALSRLGFRAITLPLVACLAFGFFWRALHRLEQKSWPWLDLVLCGSFVGLSLYTYTASRTVPFVVALTLLAAILFGRKPHLTWGRGLGALSIIALVALIVFAPLGNYVINHWSAFSNRTGEVSIFNPELAPQGPLRAFGQTLIRTALMFVSLPDANLRHNPAQRPPFDWALSAWLILGCVIALVRGRTLAYLFAFLWFLLLAVPALLSYQAAPHSLRTIGMIPAAYILIMTGLSWASERLPRHLAHFAPWLPLPFLLFSASTGVYDYFAAWRNIEKFRYDFFVDYRHVGEAIAQHSSPESVWILPHSPNYWVDDASPAFYTVNFFVRDGAGYGSVVFGEEQAPQQLAELTHNRQLIHVIQIQEAEFLARASLVFEDTKNLLPFLLHKHARLVQDESPVDIGIPYTTYEVKPGGLYLFDQNPISTTITFDGKVDLVQLDYGRTILDLAEPASALTERRAPAGHELWAVLRWQAQMPIDYDLKTSLLLKDEAGHTVNQVDQLLTGDGYPVFRTWAAGERASTYHILSIPPAIAPGEYRLYLKVYEDQTGRIYAARDEAGQAHGTEVYLGPFEVTPGDDFPPPTPEHGLPEEPALAPNLLLSGYDTGSTHGGLHHPAAIARCGGRRPGRAHGRTGQRRLPHHGLATRRTVARLGRSCPARRCAYGAV
jgi:4-amino-4-deoxy-L-arabinose transferase-like glycosyltransferase